MRVLLANVPAGQRIAERAGTAHERLVTGQTGRVAGGRIHFLGVQRLELDPFVNAGHHPFGERSAFELQLHLLLPPGVIDRVEVGTEVEFFRDRDHDDLLSCAKPSRCEPS